MPGFLRHIAALLCGVWAATPAHAEDATITAIEVVRTAVRENPALRRERLTVEIARADAAGAYGIFDVELTGTGSVAQRVTPRLNERDFTAGTNTDLNLNVGIQRLLETGGTVRLGLNTLNSETTSPIQCGTSLDVQTECRIYAGTVSLNFTHPLLRGFGRQVTEANLRRLGLNAELAEMNRRTRVANTLRDVLIAYWELYYASADLRIRRSAVELALKQLDATRAQIEVGRLAPIDAAAVERAISDRQREVLQAEQALTFRSLDLQRQLGRPIDAGLDRYMAGESPDVSPRTVEMRQELDAALTRNPQLLALRRGIALTELDLATARISLRPQLDVFANVGTTGRNREFDTALDQLVHFENFVWSSGLTFQLPVQNRLARGRAEAARLAQERTWVDVGALELDIRDLVVRAGVTITNAGERIRLAAQTVIFARRNLEAEEARFSVGRSTNNDVLLRQQELQVAEAQVERAKVDLLVAEIALDALTGDLLDRYGVKLR